MPVPLPAFKSRDFKASYDDALGPAFALGPGAAAPTAATFIAPIRILTFDPTKEDNIDFTIQFPHSQELDVNTVTVTPHVHWTCVSSPTANQLLYWNLVMAWAPPATSVATASTFYGVSSYATTVTTLTGAEYRKHMLTAFPAYSWPRKGTPPWEPSSVIIGNLRISSLSTVNASVVGLLSFDYHFWKGPNGTDTEYV